LRTILSTEFLKVVKFKSFASNKGDNSSTKPQSSGRLATILFLINSKRELFSSTDFFLHTASKKSIMKPCALKPLMVFPIASRYLIIPQNKGKLLLSAKKLADFSSGFIFSFKLSTSEEASLQKNIIFNFISRFGISYIFNKKS